MANNRVRTVGHIYPPSQWSAAHSPAANTQATISRAAAAAKRHYCTGFTASLKNLAAAAVTGTVHIRDGASGAGTILASFELGAAAGAVDKFGLSGLGLEGSLNTAMTAEFSAASGASTVQVVSLMGYTI